MLEWYENANEDIDDSIQTEKDAMVQSETEYNKTKS